jgi:predicted phosphodiesterase
MHIAFGDIHGTDVGKLKNDLNMDELDTVVCTSDFDTTESIESYLKFKEELPSRTEVVEVPGNHDSAIYNNHRINSPTIGRPYQTFDELVENLRSEKESRQFLKNLLQKPIQETEINGNKTVVVHGGLAGNLRSYKNCPRAEQPLWNRLYRSEDYQENLELMEEKGYDLMIRGHDHDPEIVREKNNAINYQLPDEPQVYNLEGDRNIVTHGAYLDNWYLEIENNEARFKKLE